MVKLFLLLLFCLGLAHAQDSFQTGREERTEELIDDELLSRRGTIKPFDQALSEEAMEAVLLSDRQKVIAKLREAKFHILNGNMVPARVILNDLLAYQYPQTKAITYRYMAMLEFIDGKYPRSWEYLQKKELMIFPHYSKVCILRTMVMVILSKSKTLEKDWIRCQVENAKELAFKDMTWMEVLVSMRLNVQENVTTKAIKKYNFKNITNDDLRLALKMALYLNQEKLVAPLIDELDQSVVVDDELRELIGMILFRTGKLARSWKFVADLSTPNVENMKGNIYGLQGKNELAYAQHKLALKLKSNSQNAMERALPLAWQLQQWKEGLAVSERIASTEKNRFQRMTTSAAFMVRLGKFAEAQNRLEDIQAQIGYSSPLEVNQLYAYTALMNNDKKRLALYADRACKQLDALSCWLLPQLVLWEDVPLTIKREEPIVETQWSWKTISEQEAAPLKETVYVNQGDIEELDDSLIQLVD